ncbi:MAG: DUF6489 family protein [Hyphomicrobiaceae bacterium]
MKIKIDIECSPQEARAFMGLPDVTAINDVVAQGLKKHVEENLEAFTDPQKFFDRMISATLASNESMQRSFASAMTNAAKSES